MVRVILVILGIMTIVIAMIIVASKGSTRAGVHCMELALHHVQESPGFARAFSEASRGESKRRRLPAYQGYIGILERKMEATIVYQGYMGIMTKKMEATIEFSG